MKIEEEKDLNIFQWNDKTILLAEDEEVNLLYLQTVLKATGIHMVTAANGLEAVDQCKKNSDISLVLMDIKMPNMDGLTATRIIKSIRHDLPVIATTAYALSTDKEKCIEAGCIDYLSKPIKRDQLLEIMNKYLYQEKVMSHER
jgi:CheY-like chemotaxis protein